MNRDRDAGRSTSGISGHAALQILVLGCAGLAWTLTASAQQTQTIDLPAFDPGETRVAPGNHTIRLQNVVPTARDYLLDVKRSASVTELAQPLPDPWSLMPAPAPAAAPAKGTLPRAPDCEMSLQHRMGELLKADTEQAVAERHADFIREAQALVDAGTCSATTSASLQQRIASGISLDIKEPLHVAPGEKVVVQVIRVGTSGKKTPVGGKVTYIGEGGTAGQWIVMYGFNFIDDDDRLYYTRERRNDAGAVTDYQVTRKRDSDGSVLAPSVYFMYLPTHNAGWLAPLAWHNGVAFGGMAAGIGLDKSNPNVFLGYGVGWGNNVMVTAGLSYRQVKRLSGRYSEGDIVPQQLTTDLETTTYKPAYYLGLAFRFGSSPFNATRAAPELTTGARQEDNDNRIH